MHAPETASPATSTSPADVDGVLNFLWLELTNRCNLQCVHCYTDSGPRTGDSDALTADHYERLMSEAHQLGCRKLQFIGGEPQLNRDFKRLLRFSGEIGFEFVEVYTNLTRLDGDILDLAVKNRVHFATSVYSDEAEKHDAVTGVRGSHRRTIGNLQRLIDHKIPTRAAVMSMSEDNEAAEQTRHFLRAMGPSLDADRSAPVRAFGRGQEIIGKAECMDGLCGHCWNGSLAVAADGSVMPCVMARQWPVGEVLNGSLADVLKGEALRRVRREIYEETWLPRVNAACSPYCYQTCSPDLSCPCNPLLCQQSCAPWDAQIQSE